jgi:hypothetical protein
VSRLQLFSYYSNILEPNSFYATYLPLKMKQSVPKRRHTNFRRRGITQKKTYNNPFLYSNPLYPLTLLPNASGCPWLQLFLYYSNILQPNSFYADLPAYEDGTDRVFQNADIQNSDTGELPRRKHTKLFIIPTHAHYYKSVVMLKQFKVITLVPTCFGSRRNHHQEAVQFLAKTTNMVFLCLSIWTQSLLLQHFSLLCRCSFTVENGIVRLLR